MCPFGRKILSSLYYEKLQNLYQSKQCVIVKRTPSHSTITGSLFTWSAVFSIRYTCFPSLREILCVVIEFFLMPLKKKLKPLEGQIQPSFAKRTKASQHQEQEAATEIEKDDVTANEKSAQEKSKEQRF